MAIDTDLFVVVGVMVALLALPSAAGAMAAARFPWISTLILAMGAGTAAAGIYASPNGYSLVRLPHSFIEILARIFN